MAVLVPLTTPGLTTHIASALLCNLIHVLRIFTIHLNVGCRLGQLHHHQLFLALSRCYSIASRQFHYYSYKKNRLGWNYADMPRSFERLRPRDQETLRLRT